MFGWLRSIFRPAASRTTPSRIEPTFGEPIGEAGGRILTLDDAEHIEAALVALTDVGLRLNAAARESLRGMAEEIAEQWEGIPLGEETSRGDWALLALSGEYGAFENAMYVQDHCFDGMLMESVGDMVSKIAGLAADEWPIESVEVAPKSVFDYGKPVIVNMNGQSPIAPFELVYDKDFDWTLIPRLNERLPETARGRFAMFHDGGNATLVFLPPANVQRLNSLVGYEFFYENRLGARYPRAEHEA